MQTAFVPIRRGSKDPRYRVGSRFKSKWPEAITALGGRMKNSETNFDGCSRGCGSYLLGCGSEMLGLVVGLVAIMLGLGFVVLLIEAPGVAGFIVFVLFVLFIWWGTRPKV